MQNKFALYDFVKNLLEKNQIFAHIEHQIIIFVNLGFLLLISFLVYYITKFFAIRIIRRITKRTKTLLDDAFSDTRFLKRASFIIPLIIIYKLTPYTLPHYVGWISLLQNATKIFIVFFLILALYALADAFYKIYDSIENTHFQPIKGYVQVFKLVIGLMGGIVILSILLSKSPAVLIGGLGALSAVLLLVFKDPLLGFTSSIQLTSNKMIQKGDWISIPSSNIDGEVEEITLSSVKIKNFDLTYSYYPTYSLLTSPFINNRGIYENKCRRAFRKIYIQPSSVKLLTKEQSLLIKDNLPSHLQSYFPVNISESITNLQLFRMLLQSYLEQDDRFDHQQLTMVYVRDVEPFGLPLFYYAFTRTTEWKEFNEINNELMELIFSLLPIFEIKLSENIPRNPMN
ncbi:MAG: mechanosensitive ion channel family protein [Bacteroidales bacterium]|nr:mechanosensitive ion channel family protein [Bacteroidales bacterium]